MRAVIIPLLFLALMTAGAGARGETGGSVFIEELTWTELRDQIAAGKTIVIVPIGGTEQNGPHMSIGKHNLRVKLLAGKIARHWERRLSRPCWPMCLKARWTGHQGISAFQVRSPFPKTRSKKP